MFNIVQQQFRHYIVAMPHELSYVSTALTSVTYVETVPKSCTHINYPHFNKELITFV